MRAGMVFSVSPRFLKLSIDAFLLFGLVLSSFEFFEFVLSFGFF